MVKVKRKCDNCGKIIEKWPYEIEGYQHHFCNRKCQGEWQSKNIKGEKSSAYKGGKVKVRCDNCGESIERVASEAKRNTHNFCNRACHTEWQRGEENRGRTHPNYGKHHSAESRGRISTNHADVRSDKNPNYGKLMSEEQKQKISEANSNPSEETRQKLREARKHLKFTKHHTKPEMIWQKIAIEMYSLPFKYTGDGSFWIGENPSLNPDFIHITKKIAIEIAGDWWHNPLFNLKLPYKYTMEYRKKMLKKYGWKLVVFFEHDLLGEDAEAIVLHTLREEGVIK